MDLRTLEPAIVVRVVHSVCDRFSNYTMDDLASDLIASIWAKEKEFENETHLRRYTWRALERHMMNQQRAKKRVKMFSESFDEGQTEEEWLDTVAGIAPMQETTMEAKLLRRIAREWPFVHKMIFRILADGGSILEAAQELGLPPWDAIRLLEECRRFVETGVSVEERRLAA